MKSLVFLFKLRPSMALFALSLALFAPSGVRAVLPVDLHDFPGPDFFPNGLTYYTNGIFLGTMHQTGPISYGGIFELNSTNGAVTMLITFGSTNGADPTSELITGSDGNFYGVTKMGGANNDGTIFQLTPSGALTTLAQFTGAASIGDIPAGELVQDASGNFYGTTISNGFSPGNVFKLTSSGTLSEFSFLSSSGGEPPCGGLTLDASGNLYGTAEYGGISNLGTVFLAAPGNVTPLFSFTGTNGSFPTSKLVFGNNGFMYGTTFSGGTGGQGTIFEIATNGAFTNLVNFGWTNGSQPQAGLTLGSDGNFYGVTLRGGTNGCGTVFQMTPSGTLNTLYSFSGPDGSQPDSPLTFGADGNLYGTTRSSLPGGNGTAFLITTGGLFTNLTYFYNADGSTPHAALVAGTNGNYYGTTEYGGQANQGTVYQMTPSGTVSTLAYFNGTNGAYPVTDLALGPNGLLYGTTYDGGSNNLGTIFSIDSTGNLSTLVTFNDTNGANPQSRLVLWSDGNFYGATCRGGTNDYGTVFQMTPAGALTTLASLSSNASPADLFMGTDGNLYGVNYDGGSGNYGAVFLVEPGNEFTNLFSLDIYNPSSVDFAGNVVGPMVQGSDDNFYGGVTSFSNGGSSSDNGGIIKATPPGVFSTPFAFNGTTGSMPTAPLVQGLDGNFYGSTFQGGAIGFNPEGYGVAYKITPSLVYSNFFSFTFTNGAFPDAALLPTPDGSFYGTATAAGGLGGGNIYQLYHVINQSPSLVSAHKNGQMVTLQWTAMTGRNYQVEYSTDLTSGNWNNVASTLTATNTIMVSVDAGAMDSARFYRIQLQ